MPAVGQLRKSRTTILMSVKRPKAEVAHGKDQKADHNRDSQPDLWAEVEQSLINRFHGSHLTIRGVDLAVHVL